MQVDCLIIGQGLAGSLLSHAMLREGLRVMVLDDARATTASKVSSGIMNPVTGKRLLRTWLWDELLPAALETYRSLETRTGTEIIRQTGILDFFQTAEAAEIFTDRALEEEEYLHGPSSGKDLEPLFNFHYGIGKLEPCWQVNAPALLTSWRKYLSAQGLFSEEQFDLSKCTISEEGATYGNIKARHIIFCQGAFDYENPYFRMLPFAGNKGEALIADIPGLPRDHIYRRGYSIVPWLDKYFWVGSTFKPLFQDLEPTAVFRNSAVTMLQQLLRIPFKIVDHLVAERPAAGGQRPFVGLHPLHPQIGIFNGLGAKGCSVGPYFARQLAQHIAHGDAIHPEAGLDRFRRMLSR